MRVEWLLLLACCATAKPADVDDVPGDDSPMVLAVTTGCSVLSQGASFDVIVQATPGAMVSASVERADGSVHIAERRAADGTPTPMSIAAASFTTGRNALSFLGYATGYKSAVRYVIVDVRLPKEGEPTTDADGDCFSPALGDCNDQSRVQSPAQTELCGDRIDNDCNGAIDGDDPLCPMGCADSDGDGALAKSCGGSDCDDGDKTSYPGATELCDGADNDCDGSVDETFDFDGDGYPACVPVRSLFRRTNGETCPSRCNDCDDDDDQIGTCDAAAAACLAAGDCSNALDGKRCNAGSCGCNTNDDCTSLRPICGAGVCRPCTAASECPADRPLCDTGGRCAECTDGAVDRCIGTAEPVCALPLSLCVACSEDDHCQATEPGGICRSTGACGCASDDSCNPGFICAASACTPGCRPRAERCPLGLDCISAPDADAGTCDWAPVH